MTSSQFDTRELEFLAKDLLGAGGRVVVNSRRAIERGARQVKDDWATNARASSGAHAPRYPDSITYDLDRGGLGAEIGPDKDRPQGALGNLLEYGSLKNPAHDDGGRALLAEGNRLKQSLTDAAEQAVFGG